MQPNGHVLRKVVLAVLFLCSIVAIMVMSVGAKADEKTAEDNINTGVVVKALENELQAEAEAIESRDEKIDLYVNYVKINGVSAQLKEGIVAVPVVFFSEAMDDCTVSFESNTLRVSTDGLELVAKIGDQYFSANNRYFYAEGKISIEEDGQIWLPLETMAKAFGCEYSLDLVSKSAYLAPTGEFLEDGDTYYNEHDVYWLSRIINAESRGEPFIGQLAVGNVVMNRVAHHRYPDSIYGVIFDGAQFSPAVSGTVHLDPYQICIVAAKIVLEGYRLNDNILFFYMMPVESSYRNGFEWTDTEIVIGNHYFYTYYGR